MVTAVRLQVEGVDLDDDLTNELLAEHFPDFLWSSVDGLVTMTVYAPEADVVCHVTDAARRVEHVVKGADVRRVHRDLVTQSDIAFRVGVSREAVRKWTHRSGDKPFPAPFDTVVQGVAVVRRGRLAQRRVLHRHGRAPARRRDRRAHRRVPREGERLP